MKRKQNNQLPKLVESFFRDQLQRVRGASRHTIRAYRDTVRLFLIFIADSRSCTVAELQVIDLDVVAVKNFLTHLESQRANKPVTRNCRLAAIRALFKHLVRNDPEHAEQYDRVLSVPSKKSRSSAATYLEPEEVRLLLRQPDRRTVLGRRNYALLLFLYNTGARVGEALSVKMEDLDFNRPAQVRLHGKGGKDRFCPMWTETVNALRSIDTVRHGNRIGTLFLNARGQSLSRDGVAYILNKYVRDATSENASIAKKKITPPY